MERYRCSSATSLFFIPHLCLSNFVVHVCYLHFAWLFLLNCPLNDQGCWCAIKYHVSIYHVFLIYLCHNSLHPSALPSLTLFHTKTTFESPGRKLIESIKGKGANGRFQNFLIFPQFFLAFEREITPLEQQWNSRVQMLWSWTEPIFVV